ncbi:hypothetical protein JCM8547_004019, partial [Rhodosporidiobolus lusitaniae]
MPSAPATLSLGVHRLRGKTAMIMGATSGIGKAMALLLAQSGVNLILTGRRKMLLANVVKEIVEVSPGILCVGLPLDMPFLGFLGSMASRQPYPSVYCASKAAVHAFAKAALKELISMPIRLSVVEPGMVETRFSLVWFNGSTSAAQKVYAEVEPLTLTDVAEEIYWSFRVQSMSTLPSFEVILDGVKGVALTDSGSQADVISSEFALRSGFELRRLVAPVHAELGADGHSVRLALYTAVPCSVGPIAHETRSFFVAPLPAGIDAILGVPWMRDSGVALSSSSLFFVPSGPSEEVYDFETGRFALQPRQNLDDLGFVRRDMDAGEQNAFVLCALAAGVPGLEDFVDYEPPNPLLDDWEDDPSKPDISAEEAADELEKLKSEFDDVF